MEKGTEVPTSLLELGLAIVEFGVVNHLPQEGNPKLGFFRTIK